MVLVGVVLLYGWLFHVIMAWEGQDHSWFTGIYWALTVMSTLGFGDITFHTDLGRAFSTIVLLSGLVLLLIILPFLFIRHVYAPWLEQRTQARLSDLRDVPEDVSGHVLICASDPIALALVRRLELSNVPAFIIEHDADTALRMQDSGIPVVKGEVDAVETLAAAGVKRARLVLANAKDTVNANIALTVRELSKSVEIAALADFEDSIDILEMSGATHVLPLTRRLGEHLANRVSGESTRANVIGRFHDLLLAEFHVRNTQLEGQTIRETRLREEIGASIVGVWQRGRLVPAAPDVRLSALGIPVVVGTAEQIEELNRRLADDLVDRDQEEGTGPVLVLGGGRVGRAVARALKKRDMPVHMVERNAALERKLAGIPDRLVLGNAADREVLIRAGIRKAPSVVLTTHDDATNVYLTLYCRRLNPGARILTRVTHERNVTAIQRAGADFVLSYVSLGVQTVFAIAQRRELIVLGEGVDLFYIPVPSSIADQTLAETAIGARTGLNVIAIHQDGKVLTDLGPRRQLARGTSLLALGSAEQRRRFAELYT
jgi:Trk K+ transport system NAD-binding subunit